MLVIVWLIMVADASSVAPAEHLRQQLVSEPKHERRSEYGGVPPVPSNKNEGPIVRKPRNREITSRYKLVSQGTGAPGCNQRCASPDFGRSPHPSEFPKRAISADRKHSSTPLNLDNKSSSLLLPKSGRKVSKELWPPDNNLSASKQMNFTSNGSQEEDASLKIINGIQSSACLDDFSQRALPFRCNGADQTENLRPVGSSYNKHEASWGDKGKNCRSGSFAVSRSLDFCMERQRSSGDAKTASSIIKANNFSSRNGSARLLPRTRSDISISAVSQAKLSGEIHEAESIKEAVSGDIRAPLNEVETASSENFLNHNSEAGGLVTEEPVGNSNPRENKMTFRGTIVPARFWQNPGSCVRRFSEGDFKASSASERDPLKRSQRSKAASPGPSPPHSPSDMSKSFQYIASIKETPNLSKAKVLLNGHTIQSMISSVVLDSKKGKKNPNQQEDAHILRILQNRLLQWRFTNAQAQLANASQKGAAENQLYNVWLQTSELRTSVAEKRIKLQQARLFMKIESVISCHGELLQAWGALYPDHATALAQVLRGLEATILKLPLTCGSKAEILTLQESLNSAVLLMKDVSSSIESLQLKAESVATFLSELAEIAVQERSLLEESGDLFHFLAAMEVEECSLRAYFVQLQYDQIKGAMKSKAVNQKLFDVSWKE